MSTSVSQGVATIVDNDPLPSLSVSQPTVTEGSSGAKNLSFEVSLSAASGQPVSVSYATVDGTAVAGSDYTALSGTVTIPAGQTSATINVAPLDDALAEPTETVIVTLQSVTSGDPQIQIDAGQNQATLAVADAAYCFPLPERYGDAEAAPLLCAGLIGYRSLRMVGRARRLGIWGFGAAAHIIAQVARHEGRELYAFTRPGDAAAQDFAMSLGAVWAGDADAAPPGELDAALIFAPVGALVPTALAAVRKGGIVVCGGIHMSDIPAMCYASLWEERELVSVANLTRRDAAEFFPVARHAKVETSTAAYPLEQANRALDDLRAGRLSGAAVLVPGQGHAAVD